MHVSGASQSCCYAETDAQDWPMSHVCMLCSMQEVRSTISPVAWLHVVSLHCPRLRLFSLVGSVTLHAAGFYCLGACKQLRVLQLGAGVMLPADIEQQAQVIAAQLPCVRHVRITTPEQMPLLSVLSGQLTGASLQLSDSHLRTNFSKLKPLALCKHLTALVLPRMSMLQINQLLSSVQCTSCTCHPMHHLCLPALSVPW